VLRRLIPALLFCVGLVGVGSAGAKLIEGTSGPDRLNGTARPDQLYGRAGNDQIDGRGASDVIDGGPGRDRLSGSGGADRLVTNGDVWADSVSCGSARDVVTADPTDHVAANCEVVSRQVSRDRDQSAEAQHETQVEPDSAAYGSTIVTVFQSGRFIDGGAASIGFATSRNRGLTWRSGDLPRLSISSKPAGPYFAVSDPVVAYDRIHRWWLAVSLGSTFGLNAIAVSRSRDGVTWNAPVDAARSTVDEYDKEWATCDNWASSRFSGTCYVAYMNFTHATIELRRSTDGGRTWSAATSIEASRPRNVVNGVQIAVRPNGDVVLVFSAFGGLASTNELASTLSTDGGATFGPPVHVGALVVSEPPGCARRRLRRWTSTPQGRSTRSGPTARSRSSAPQTSSSPARATAGPGPGRSGFRSQRRTRRSTTSCRRSPSNREPAARGLVSRCSTTRSSS
jgi:hypothetical protein